MLAQTRTPAHSRGPAFFFREKSALAADLHDVFGRGALGTMDDVELNALTLGERAEATALNRGMMDEAVLLTTFGRDKAKALRVVEPLHGAGRTSHVELLKMLLCRRSSGTCRTHRPTVTRELPHDGNVYSDQPRPPARLETKKRPSRMRKPLCSSRNVFAHRACDGTQANDFPAHAQTFFSGRGCRGGAHPYNFALPVRRYREIPCRTEPNS